VSTENLISVQNVCKTFDEFQALKSVSLEIGVGERVVVCGPSGSGKSTLIRCINQLEHHESGKILIDGIEVKTGLKNQRPVLSRIGMVFQQFNLFPHLTVLENLTLGPLRARKMKKDQADSLATSYLERVHIPEQADKFPRQLSGGQQQRVAIARSLCMQPDIMLFDEPTSALDPEMINEVLDVMVELADSGMTMICVTHEMGFARKIADNMVFMDHGKIVESSPPEKFFSNPDSERCQDFLQKILHH
jgi:ABC-type polar amino acid transport system ATPase subunit